MKQIYHPYTKWECYKNGMWRMLTKEEIATSLQPAIIFTGNHLLYGRAMSRVISEWRYSCEHHLTDNSINKKAWLGHAACCLQNGWSEGLVRMAWHNLTYEQQELANAQAEKYINIWVQNHTFKHKKHNYAQTEIRFECV